MKSMRTLKKLWLLNTCCTFMCPIIAGNYGWRFVLKEISTSWNLAAVEVFCELCKCLRVPCFNYRWLLVSSTLTLFCPRAKLCSLPSYRDYIKSCHRTAFCMVLSIFLFLWFTGLWFFVLGTASNWRGSPPSADRQCANEVVVLWLFLLCYICTHPCFLFGTGGVGGEEG